MVDSINNADPTDGSVDNAVTAIVKTPGQILQDARFAKDMSETDIANSLHLSRSVIQAIEKDAYEKLPGVTFVRGYLRSYARAVDISSEDIMDAFGAMGLEEHAPMLAPVTRVKKQISATDRSVRWVTYVIVATLIALVVLWWRNHNESSMGDEVIVPEAVDASADSVSSNMSEPKTPIEPIAGNDVKGAVGNKNTSTGATAGANETANSSNKSEKVLNSDRLRDKKKRGRRAENTVAQPSASMASNTSINDRLNMSGFDKG